MTNDEFDRILHDQPKVLAKFSAKWCGPCKAMEPVLQQLEGKADFPTVVRIDVEEDVDVSARFGVRAMPTFLLFDRGKLMKTQVGAMSANQLTQFVSSFEPSARTASYS